MIAPSEGQFDPILHCLQETGHAYRMQHIKEIDAVGGAGLKLKVYNNGNYDKPAIVYFNPQQASKGIKDSKLVFERVSLKTAVCWLIDAFHWLCEQLTEPVNI